MELRRDNVVTRDACGEIPAVMAGPEKDLRRDIGEVVAVHEVEIRRAADPREQRMIAEEGDGIPADMGHLEIP